jgi:16S rRNA (guanine527-N7)-methyltransferase
VEHALGFARAAGELLSRPAKLLDLGSGGGLPGLVLATYYPGLRATLLDGRTERAARLEAAVRELDLADRVKVLAERAEDAGRDAALRAHFDCVVARSFGRPGVTAECAAPFLRVGGILVVSEPPPDAGARERWPTQACATLGLVREPHGGNGPTFVVLRQVLVCPDRYPRRIGIPAKRPLF